jgi:hypothetical protein
MNETDSPQGADGPADELAPADEAAQDDPVPMNRAERRAHARGGAAKSGFDRGNTGKGKGATVASPRQWANRRSG